MRPRLPSALRPLWRDPATLQLGVDQRHALVLDGLTAQTHTLLGLLDGSRDVAGVVDAAAAVGLGECDVRLVLDQLGAAGALDDAALEESGLGDDEVQRLRPDLAALSLLAREAGAGAAAMVRRRGGVVLVVGAGRVGAMTASLLAAAGVGRVIVRDDADSVARRCDAVPGGIAVAGVGLPRAVAAARAGAPYGIAPSDGVARTPDRADCCRADLAVICPDPGLAPTPALLAVLHAVGLPYLLAGVRETLGSVGPLVLPGRTSCPRCVDLAHADRDPGWATVAAQLSTAAPGMDAACDVALASAVAAVATGQVLVHLDGLVASSCLDATLELRLPEWSMRRNVRGPHPSCGCLDGVRAV